MHEIKKSRTDSVILLSVGLLAGFLIAGVLFFTVFRGSSDSVPAQQAQTTLVQPQVNGPFVAAPMAAPAVAAPVTVMSSDAGQQQVPGVVMQTYAGDGSGMVGTNVSMSSSGAGGNYTFVNPVYGGNPNWTMGRNGEIGNPAVDPPSSKGRAYGLDGSAIYDISQ